MHTGHCLCGDVSFTVDGDAINTSFCHCPSCKRAAGATMVAWAMFDDAAVKFAGAPRATYASSEGVARGFCGKCGTTLSFEAGYMPGLIDVTIASFDDPSAFPPSMHIFTRHSEPFMQTDDGLPRFEELPPFE